MDEETSFASIISKEEWDYLGSTDENGLLNGDRGLFLIQNDVLILSNGIFIYNAEVAIEVVSVFEQYSLEFYAYNEEVRKLKIIIGNLDKPSKKFIKKNLDEYLKKFKKHTLIKYLIESKHKINLKDINPCHDEFTLLMLDLILNEEKIILDYIINGENMDVSSHSIFRDWLEIRKIYKIISFLKNPFQVQQFGNVLFPEQYLKLKDPLEFEIQNNIILKRKCIVEPENVDEDSFQCFEYVQNILLTYQIYKCVKFNVNFAFDVEINFVLNKIKIELNNSFDNLSKKKIIREIHKKYFNKIKNNRLTKYLSVDDESLNTETNIFEKITWHLIKDDNNLQFKYITQGEHMIIEEPSIIDEWLNLKIFNFVSHYLKEYEQKKINSAITNRNLNKKLITKENLIHQTLTKLNAFDEKGGTKRSGFRTYCWAIGEVVVGSDNKKIESIFGYSFKNNEFIDIINREYNTNYKRNKGKLITIYTNQTDKHLDKTASIIKKLLK